MQLLPELLALKRIMLLPISMALERSSNRLKDGDDCTT
jgi:hypothetical protein